MYVNQRTKILGVPRTDQNWVDALLAPRVGMFGKIFQQHASAKSFVEYVNLSKFQSFRLISTPEKDNYLLALLQVLKFTAPQL